MTHRTSLFEFTPERHRDVRLLPGIDLAESFLTHYAEIGLDEVGAAAADYPLLFLKDSDTGRLRLVALLGLAPRQNSYVIDEVWQAVYLPLKIAVAPFCYSGAVRILCIDEANPRVTTDDGDALFNDDASDTPVLVEIRKMLGRLEQGCAAADRLIDTLLELELVQAVSITAVFVSGAEDLVQGLYSIDPRMFGMIEPAALLNLHSADMLVPMCTIIQSLNQLNRVKQLHNLGSGSKISAFRITMGAA